jgi:broad specificity phosphatase PhoE
MTPLRQRMLQDMQMRNFSCHTHEAYLRAVAKLASFYKMSPDRLDLEQVRAFLVHLADQQVSFGLFNQTRAALVFQDVHDRVVPALEQLLAAHTGESVLVVAHHVVLRVYLAGLLGLAPGQARRVKLDNGSISVVVRQGHHTSIRTLNGTTHLSTLKP